MLEGLEINEIYIKELERTSRLDSEFYKKENIDALAGINKFQHVNLNEVVFISDGNHMAISESFIDKGIPYYRGQDTHHFFIENANPICIDNKTFNSPYMLRSHIKRGDVLLSIVGTIGKLSLVYTELGATCSCKLAILRPKKVMSPELISVYLSCYYGQNQIKKFTRGAVQMGLILEDMDQIIIPKFSANFDSKIVNLVENSYSGMKLSANLYMKAEDNLLNSISVNIDTKYSSTVNLKSFKESFLTTGRLDAEYYQPKYDHLFSHISKLESKKLGEIVNIKKSIEPGSDAYQDTGIPFVRVSNLSKFGLTKPEIHLDANKYGNITLYPNKDTILLSKDGSVGIAYKVEEDMEIITSGALLHLNIIDNEFLPDYLTLVLNSPIVQLQAERDAGGSIIQHWKPSEIEEVIIPNLPLNSQKKISDLILQSFKLKKQSEQLLEIAKKAVEIAIEQNEATAIDYINSYSELMQEDRNWH